MAKIKNNVFGIFVEGVKLYFRNFDQFMKYLAFPVLGQIIGMILIVLASYLYQLYLPVLIEKSKIFDNFSVIFLLLLLISLPGLFIFIRAILSYLVAYGAINSMTENMLKSGRVYDFAAHNELINRRIAGFFGVWLLFGIFSILAIIPFFWIISAILFVYFVLIFQVFTFEPDKSPVGCFKKSFTIIKGNFARTFYLLLLVGVLTYMALPELFKYLCEVSNIITFLAVPVDVCTRQLPIDEINKAFSSLPNFHPVTSITLAKSTVATLISYTVSCFTLPIRSICWSLWYKNLNKAESKIDKKFLDRAIGEA